VSENVTRVEGLHEQGSDACHERRHSAVHGPRRRADAEEPRVVTLLDLVDPIRATLPVAGEGGQHPGSPY
jgi:hypothetical protein